jgi:RsiW-degrading membrane proteinase PrsW (M82 family)
MGTFLALALSVMAAVVPTTLYALAFYLADRYEREPKWLVSLAFLWGAVPAIVASLIGELVIGTPFVNAPGSVAGAVVGSAIVAPIVEELTKGFAVWTIYKLFRQEFDGVLDGLTYGALIGFGFAMTENFLYFIGAFNEGGFASLTFTIVLRSVVFGLNHALYTALFGMGLGLARQSRTKAQARFWAGLGLAAAIAAHAMHNLGASITSFTALGLLLSLVLALAGFFLIVVAFLLAWRQERSWIREGLRDEVGVLLTQAEYEMMASGRHRPRLSLGPRDREQASRLRLLVELAFRKHRLRRLGPDHEPGIEEQIEALRRKIAQ